MSTPYVRTEPGQRSDRYTCPHEPRCRTVHACIERALAEARQRRELLRVVPRVEKREGGEG